MPEHVRSQVLVLSSNGKVPPRHSLEIGGDCPLIEVPGWNRHTTSLTAVRLQELSGNL